MKLIWKLKSFQELQPNELYRILQQRTAVFVMEQNCHYQDCDNKDLQALHFWAEIDEEIVAYARLLPVGVAYAQEVAIGRVLTNLKFRNQNHGRQLMQYAIEILKNLYPENTIRISAQAYLKNFYESLGFVTVSDEYLIDAIPHIDMIRQ
ncbi:GNAT family N-acetyltransferase [Vaginella massiliensis]|uniref:GNAT family N-acetyltransferase n=1 Tax=Vaginella massiliensis TaxID=1816680 RepID=UPI0008389715|nr:GNAT family N-acetyltransferase [Vaginella massiliensis]